MDNLDHVKLIEFEKGYGPISMGVYIALFNSENISEKEALRVIQSDDYSPNVITMTKAQYEHIFLNKKD